MSVYDHRPRGSRREMPWPHAIRRFAAVIAAVCVLGAAGCGSSSDGDAGASKGGSKSSTSVAASQKPGGGGGAAGSGAAGKDSKNGKSPGSGASQHAGGADGGSGAGAAQGGGQGAAPGAANGAQGSGSGGIEVSSEGLPTGEALQELIEVARTSVTDVPMLHNFAVGLGRTGGMPNDLIATQANELKSRFTTGAKRASSSSGEAASVFADAMDRYATLADQLHTAADKSKPLPKDFAADMAAADGPWRAAVQAIGDAGGVDLLATLPPLLMPDAASSSTIPPPPK